MSQAPSQPSLGDVLDLARQLAQDEDRSGPDLRHRDREVGRRLGHLEHRPVPQSLAWLHAVRDGADRRRAAQINGLHRLGLVALAVAGLITGWGTASVIYFYDGTHPVNVIHVLAVFALLPLVLLVGFGVGLLPRVPGVSTLQDGLGLLNPGRLLHLLARRLPQSFRETIGSWLGRGQAHQRLFGRVDRWLLTHASQIFALCFQLGAVAGAVALVMFSDLAFAWSTTLQQTPTGLQTWTDLLSLPWAWAWPDAHPSLELIERTRYFRLGDGSFPAAPPSSPAGLGGWWPFLVMCMAVYGVLPRVLTLLLARWRLRTALRHACRHLPGLDEVRMRLTWALVETQADEPEAAGTGAAAQAMPTASPGGPAGDLKVVDWAGAVTDRAGLESFVRHAFGAGVTSVMAAGGTRSTDEDAAVRRELPGHGVTPALVVKGWEPPMAELHDFLQALRRDLGDGQRVLVVPVGPDGGPAEARHVDMWARSLAQLGDPWLRVSVGKEDAS